MQISDTQMCVCVCEWVKVSVGGGPWSALTRAIKFYKHEAHLSIMLTGWPHLTPPVSEPQESPETPDWGGGMGGNKHLMIQGMFKDGSKEAFTPAFVTAYLSLEAWKPPHEKSSASLKDELWSAPTCTGS